MQYEDADQLDRSLKKAIKLAGGDPGEAYRQTLRDRFLCRVFSDPKERFILKGGSSLLARIPDARATRDIDFAMRDINSVDEAVDALNLLASKDLGDFCSFKLTKREETLDDNGYSRLVKLRYATYIGLEEKDPILIDLSLDCSPTLSPERIKPANRVPVEGLATCDYLVYSLADQLADKLCAIMERQPGGWESSRMKDLTDVVAYATNETFHAEQLAYAITCECRRRQMDMPKAFSAPVAWASRFSAFAKASQLTKEFQSFDAACMVASSFFNPVLARRSDERDKVWDPSSQSWR